MVVLDHPVVRHKTTLLRSVDTDMRLFRALVHEISLFVLYEATRRLPSEPMRVETPMAPYDGARVPGSALAIVPVLRAGLGMLDAAHELLPHAPVGFVGVTRDEETLRPVPTTSSCPTASRAAAFRADPMPRSAARPRTRSAVPRGRRRRHHARGADRRGPRGSRVRRSSPRRLSRRARRASEQCQPHRPGLGDAGDRMWAGRCDAAAAATAHCSRPRSRRRRGRASGRARD